VALDSAAIWGEDVADAIKAVGIVAGSDITDIQLETVWAAIKGEDRTQLTTKALISTTVTGVTGVGTPGGPLPLAAVPGTGGIS